MRMEDPSRIRRMEGIQFNFHLILNILNLNLNLPNATKGFQLFILKATFLRIR